jgi:hypothetical protein
LEEWKACRRQSRASQLHPSTCGGSCPQNPLKVYLPDFETASKNACDFNTMLVIGLHNLGHFRRCICPPSSGNCWHVRGKSANTWTGQLAGYSARQARLRQPQSARLHRQSHSNMLPSQARYRCHLPAWLARQGPPGQHPQSAAQQACSAGQLPGQVQMQFCLPAAQQACSAGRHS